MHVSARVGEDELEHQSRADADITTLRDVVREYAAHEAGELGEGAVGPGVDLDRLLANVGGEERGVVGDIGGVVWRGDGELDGVVLARLSPEEAEEEG